MGGAALALVMLVALGACGHVGSVPERGAQPEKPASTGIHISGEARVGLRWEG